MESNRTAQAIIAPLATLLTTFLWLETWVEILSRGAYHSPDDLSKYYLGVMTAYAGAAEISKWLNTEPTDPTQDPRFERVQRGGFFVWLWLAPLLFAYAWRITNPSIPMPGPLQKIAFGIVGIFFLKAASRRWRHKKHGVLNPVTGEVKSGNEAAPENDFADTLYARIAAAPDGMTIGELFAAFPDVTKPRLYRTFDKLVAAHRLSRTGKPRTPDVRYRALGQNKVDVV